MRIHTVELEEQEKLPYALGKRVSVERQPADEQHDYHTGNDIRVGKELISSEFGQEALADENVPCSAVAGDEPMRRKNFERAFHIDAGQLIDIVGQRCGERDYP